MDLIKANSKLYKFIYNLLSEYENQIDDIEHHMLEAGPGISVKMRADKVQVYPSSTITNIYVSVNGIAKTVDSFEDMKNFVEYSVSN